MQVTGEFSALAQDIIEFSSSARKAAKVDAKIINIIATRHVSADGEKGFKLEIAATKMDRQALLAIMLLAVTEAMKAGDGDVYTPGKQ